jgi:prepilin-type N-terminal cleavage/methylation domain-containing protein
VGPRRGLTLVELLVVLTILAIMATVAVTSTQVIVDQGRYEATKRTLSNIEEAIVGPADQRQPDGSPLITGFIADVGRPPLVTGTEPTTQLAELWDANLWSDYPFAVRAGPAIPTDYSDIRLPCGWRGPYTRLGPGITDLRDGWGNEFQIATSTPGDPVQAITWNTVSPYTEDLSVAVTSGLVTVSGTVTKDGAAPSSASVVLLHPDPTRSATHLFVMDDEDLNVGTFVFRNVPIGLRAIRADIEGHLVTKYVYVPRTGLSLSLNYVTPPPSP